MKAAVPPNKEREDRTRQNQECPRPVNVRTSVVAQHPVLALPLPDPFLNRVRLLVLRLHNGQRTVTMLKHSISTVPYNHDILGPPQQNKTRGPSVREPGHLEAENNRFLVQPRRKPKQDSMT